VRGGNAALPKLLWDFLLLLVTCDDDDSGGWPIEWHDCQ